jgi:uncharacterized protein YndB with AHSA1/START domain
MGLSSDDSRTRVERASDRELVVTRTFDAPARIVFEAWTTPALFMRWWAPRSSGVPMRSCVMDVRIGGGYRIEFGKGDANTMAFFGKYVEVVPNARLVWTNDEGGEGGPVTTVTFEETDGRTLVTYRELYASRDAFDQAFEGMEGGMPEQFEQLAELLAGVA